MIKFKFRSVVFIISFLTAILVITNGNGSLFQNAFGDSDSIEDSVDEIVESAEKESDEASDDAEDLAEEAKEDSGDVVRDRDSEESEDDEDNGDESEDRSEDDSNDAFSDLESEIEEVGQIEDNIDKDDSDDTPGLGEGSGMQIFVSPRERVNEILDQHLDNIEDQVNIQEDFAFHPEFTPGGVGASPGNVPTIPRLGLTFDEDFNNLSTGHGNEGNHIFLSPIFGGLAPSPGGNDGDGNNPPPGFNIPPCTGITFCDSDNGQNNGLQGTNPDELESFFETILHDVPGNDGLQGTNPEGIIEGGLIIIIPGDGAINIPIDIDDIFPTGGVGASSGVIDLGPCDGGGLELISGTGLCSLKDLISIDLFE